MLQPYGLMANGVALVLQFVKQNRFEDGKEKPEDEP